MNTIIQICLDILTVIGATIVLYAFLFLIDFAGELLNKFARKMIRRSDKNYEPESEIRGME